MFVCVWERDRQTSWAWTSENTNMPTLGFSFSPVKAWDQAPSPAKPAPWPAFAMTAVQAEPWVTRLFHWVAFLLRSCSSHHKPNIPDKVFPSLFMSQECAYKRLIWWPFGKQWHLLGSCRWNRFIHSKHPPRPRRIQPLSSNNVIYSTYTSNSCEFFNFQKTQITDG